MLIKVKAPFFDKNGLHKKGDLLEVNSFDNLHHERVEEQSSEPKTRGRKAKK